MCAYVRCAYISWQLTQWCGGWLDALVPNWTCAIENVCKDFAWCIPSLLSLTIIIIVCSYVGLLVRSLASSVSARGVCMPLAVLLIVPVFQSNNVRDWALFNGPHIFSVDYCMHNHEMRAYVREISSQIQSNTNYIFQFDARPTHWLVWLWSTRQFCLNHDLFHAKPAILI